ncbi:MAG: cyclase family protein [Desulfobacterales bacterium]|nr:cyclase family protein [Desulfobacterales bacterium]
MEILEVSTHAGTHMDAPWHYHPTQDRGMPALTIDEFPLEWAVGSGVKVDFSARPDGYNITPDDIRKELDALGITLREGDIFLAQTGAAAFWGEPDYLVKGCGFGKAATLWLVDQGIHVVGTDAWSWDRPLPFQAADFERTKDPSLIWEGHFAGIEKGYFQIEKLTNLDRLPLPGSPSTASPSRSRVRALAGSGCQRKFRRERSRPLLIHGMNKNHLHGAPERA